MCSAKRFTCRTRILKGGIHMFEREEEHIAHQGHPRMRLCYDQDWSGTGLEGIVVVS